MKKLIVLGLFGCLLCSFSAPPQPTDQCRSARQLYEENMEINIQRCVKASVDAGKDSATAYRQCKYALEKAFEIDSTFYKMNEKQQQEFLNRHRDELMIE